MTCLLTLPDSLRNSGYSSMKRFMSVMDSMLALFLVFDWYCSTYSLMLPPRSPKLRYMFFLKKGSWSGDSTISFSSGLISGTSLRSTLPLWMPRRWCTMA